VFVLGVTSKSAEVDVQITQALDLRKSALRLHASPVSLSPLTYQLSSFELERWVGRGCRVVAPGPLAQGGPLWPATLRSSSPVLPSPPPPPKKGMQHLPRRPHFPICFVILVSPGERVHLAPTDGQESFALWAQALKGVVFVAWKEGGLGG
jgi:hypothetical protein